MKKVEEEQTERVFDLPFDQVQWFTIDTRLYPALEDSRHSKVITGPGEKYRSGGSYIYLMLEGKPQLLDFKFDPSIEMAKLQKKLRLEILEAFIRPLVKLIKCEQISFIYTKKENINYFAVWFQSKNEDDINADDKDTIELNMSLNDLARREYFYYQKEERVKFYRIYDQECALKYGIKSKDTLVFFPKIKGEEDKMPPISNDNDRSKEKIAIWLATAISDIETVFSKRVVYSIMQEETNAIMLLRTGGKPKDVEDFEDMDKVELRLC